MRGLIILFLLKVRKHRQFRMVSILGTVTHINIGCTKHRQLKHHLPTVVVPNIVIEYYRFIN